MSECIHHWLIEPAAGPYSSAVCKLCGATKSFPNSSNLSDREAKNLRLGGTSASKTEKV